MTKEEMREWKMNLLENISKAKNSMNLPKLKMETEFIFGFCKNLSNIGDYSLYQRDIFLKAYLRNSISSYYLNPNLGLEDRVAFINGIIYAADKSIIAEPSFNSLSVEAKTDTIYEEYISSLKQEGFNIDRDYLSYMKLGIKAELEMQEISKRK